MTQLSRTWRSFVNWLMARNIVGPKELIPAAVIAALVVAWLVIRRHRGWTRTVAICAGVGAVVGVIAWFLGEKVLNLTLGPMPMLGRIWVVAFFIGLGLVVANFRWSTWRRKVAAVLAAVVLLGATVLAVNKAYQINTTLGALLGRVPANPITLPAQPTSSPSHHEDFDGAHWVAPADMPAKGQAGNQYLPGKVSGFHPRSASIYLPPAALVANAPKLPVVVFMMGQPGTPDAPLFKDQLDGIAAAHNGLSPIVVFVDQLGNPNVDTLCLDTQKFGNVETYINTDVVNWVRENLNVSTDRQDWTVGGYSQGGQCAVSFGAKHPDLWGNVMSVSGEAYPGFDHAPDVLANVFHGDQGAYDAVKPSTILAKNHYPDTWAFFSYGTDDHYFGPSLQELAQQAAAAGMTVKVDPLENAGHLMPAVRGGLGAGLEWLYPRTGLS